MLRLGILVIACACAASPQPDPDSLQIEAVLRGRVSAPHELVEVQFVIANRSSHRLTTPDPSHGTALRIHLRTPSGERVFSAGEPNNLPGATGIARTWHLPSGVRRAFDFDLAALARLTAPGNYTAVLEYLGRGPQPWRSAELNFTMTPPAGASIEVWESESSRRGPASLLWTEREGSNARVLLFPQLTNPEMQEIWGASNVSGVPANGRPDLSIGPPGQDFPDRWLAWTEGPQLHYQYVARDPAVALPPATLAIPADARLVRAPLADPPPGTGRPGCHVAWISRNRIERAAIDGRGHARLLAPVALPGDPVGAWAVSPRNGERVYVAALSSADQSQLVSVRCQTDSCSTPVVRSRMPGRVEAGDLRIAVSGPVAALVLSRPGGWLRATVPLTPGLAAQTDPVPQVTRADRVRVKVDAAGRAHVVLADGLQYLYFRPGAKSAARLAGSGPLFDLFFAQEMPYLVVYDPQRGPIFLPLPQ